jgi:putative transposase
MPLRIRTFECPACGLVIDRDHNAAKNILAAGRAERLNACGEGVRPGLALATVDETGTDIGRQSDTDKEAGADG